MPELDFRKAQEALARLWRETGNAAEIEDGLLVQATLDQARAEIERLTAEAEKLRSDHANGLREAVAWAQAEIGRLRSIIIDLLKHLPDSGYEGREDETWDWCWNELSSDAQDAVKAVRARATAVLNQDH